MTNNYLTKKDQLKPKRSTIDFILNYSRNLQVIKVNSMNFNFYKN